MGLLPIAGRGVEARTEGGDSRVESVGADLFIFVDVIYLDCLISSRKTPGRAQGVEDRPVSETLHARFSCRVGALRGPGHHSDQSPRTETVLGAPPERVLPGLYRWSLPTRSACPWLSASGLSTPKGALSPRG